MSVGKQFFPETWDEVVQCVRDIYLASVPHQLLSWKPDDSVMRRCVLVMVFCLQSFPMHRSYSTLSVGSTRSSLMSDFQDTPKAPSVISNSEQPPTSDLLVSDSGMVRSSSPIGPEDRLKNWPPVVETAGDDSQPGTVEGVSDAQRGDIDVNAGEGVTVAEVNDEEFGQFISVSNVDSRAASDQPGPQVDSTQPSDETHVTGSDHEVGGVMQHDTKPEADAPAAPEVTGTPQVEDSAVQISSLSESTVMPADSSVHPEGKNNIGNSTDTSLLSNQSPLKGIRDAGKASNQISEVDRLSLKKNAVKVVSRTGKKMPKNQKSKEKGRKSRGKAEAVVDDNQSEVSYQPDTDLSRSKASKKVNSKFWWRLTTLC